MTRWRALGALGLALAATAGFYAFSGTDSPGHIGPGRYRDGRGRIGRGGRLNQAPASYASFAFAPLGGAGMGTECACTNPTGIHGETLTFARASSGFCTKQDGTLVLCAANQPRVMSGAIDSSWLGVLVEPTQMNQFYYASDLSNAYWVKSSMSCVYTATGPDGVANGASTCTSSGANGTVTAATIAAGTGVASVYLKRRTGTGAILITRNNFSTTVDVGPALSSSRYKRVVPIDTPGCSGGDCIIATNLEGYGAGNQILGLKFAVSGDAVDVWTFQEENWSGADTTTTLTTAPTSPINGNTGIRAVRAADYRVSFPVSLSGPVASMSVQHQYTGTYASRSWTLIATSASEADYLSIDSFAPTRPTHQVECWRFVGGGLANAGGQRGVPFSADTFLSTECQSISASTNSVTVRGGISDAPVANGSVNVTAAKVLIGNNFTTGTEQGGVYRGICVGTVLGSCSYDGGSTGGTPIAWVGDSITLGDPGSAPTRPPNSLETLFRVNGAVSDGRAVYNMGIGGNTTTDCLANWRANVRHHGFSTLVLLCGVNSSIQSVPATAAAAFADLQAIMDEARADGLKVIPVTVMPYGGGGGYVESINSSLSTYATAHSLTLVDAYTAFKGTAAAPTFNLNATYDYGDHIHVNAAGADLLASLVYAASP